MRGWQSRLAPSTLGRRWASSGLYGSQTPPLLATYTLGVTTAPSLGPTEPGPAARTMPSLREILPRWVPFRIVGPPSPPGAPAAFANEPPPPLAEILPPWISARRVERRVEPPADAPAALESTPATLAGVGSAEPSEIELEAAPLPDPAPASPPTPKLPLLADDPSPPRATHPDALPLALVGLEPPPDLDREYSPLTLAGMAAPDPSDLEHAPLTLAGIVPPKPADLDRARYFTTTAPPPAVAGSAPGGAEPPFPGSFAELLRRIAEAETKTEPPGSPS